jgi:hypothetical protein
MFDMLSGQYKNLASKGRYGDTMLAHINPQEAALLKSMGGAGTINPQTGLREFYGISQLRDMGLLEKPYQAPVGTYDARGGGPSRPEPFDRKFADIVQGGMGVQRVTGYTLPSDQTFANIPLVTKYDPKGNFNFLTLEPGQYLTPDPSRPNIQSVPRLNASGEVVDWGIVDVNDLDNGSFGSMIRELGTEFAPMIIAGLLGNFAAGNLGSLGGAAGASSGTGLTLGGSGLGLTGTAGTGLNLAATTGGGLGLTAGSAGAGLIGAGLGTTLAAIDTGIAAGGGTTGLTTGGVDYGVGTGGATTGGTGLTTGGTGLTTGETGFTTGVDATGGIAGGASSGTGIKTTTGTGLDLTSTTGGGLGLNATTGTGLDLAATTGGGLGITAGSAGAGNIGAGIGTELAGINTGIGTGLSTGVDYGLTTGGGGTGTGITTGGTGTGITTGGTGIGTGVGTSLIDTIIKNPSIAGAVLGAVTSAVGSANAPTSTTTTTSIDPQIKAEYLANLERAKTTAAGLEARQIAQPGQLYNDAERQLYNLGMTPFGEADIARFFNPYQEQVVQGALGDIERTRLMQEQANRDQATRARAFGGSRQAIVSGMTNEAALRQAANTSAQLRSAGYTQAANLGLAARPMNMAGLQTSLGLGTTRTALEQARLDALRNLGQERLAITSGGLSLQPANTGGTTSQPLYNNTAGNLLSGGLTGAYIGSLFK